jgi:two-component system phosphate regulon response regulator PhoB
MSRKRILIIEDERDMADLVAMRLSREHYDVQVARDGIEGIEKIRSGRPDLVVLDLMLPGMSGSEIATHVRSDPRTASIPILMLTARSEESDIIVGLKLGADDYVTKPFSMSVLLARIAALLRRSADKGSADSGLIKAGPIVIDQRRHQVQVNGESITLTLTEFRILTALAAARGRVLSRNQLIDQILGVDAVVTDRTIDVHLTALRRKLGVARKHIQTVRGLGYKLASEDETA